MSTDQRIVRDWLKALGVLVAGTLDRKEAEQRLAAYVPMLADEFPPGAFTKHSLNAVAKASLFFPAYAEVVQRLSAWWHENRDVTPALPAPVEESEWETLRREWGDADAVRQSIRLCEGDERFLRMLAALVARHAPQNLSLVAPKFWPSWAKARIEGKAP